ncbi:MAG: hypothetical protein ABI639_12925 [Thermoanaerobaculia bacterium]
MPPHVFAVRRRELRFASFSRASGASALELAEFHALPLADGLFGSGPLGVPVGDSAALAESVKMLLARVATPVKEASLVMPDSWTRSMVIELGDLPDEPAARVEVLRFRIKRTVPYRVEDLRIEAVPLSGGEGSTTPTNYFVTLANASVCTVLEQGFARCGVRIGRISGATLATMQALDRGDRNRKDADRDAGDRNAPNRGLVGLALVDSDGFTLVLARDGEPLIYRQKSFTEGLSDADRSRLLTAELRLTRTYLTENHPREKLTELYVAAPRAVEPFWMQVLGQGLECEPSRLRVEHLGLSAEGFGDSLPELAPLAGAASREVA